MFATETHADDLIPVQVEYRESSNEILQNIPIDVVADSGRKRKRGRPKSEKTIAVYQNGGSGEGGGMGIINNNGVVVDVAALANAEDPFGPELRRRTEGLTTEEELLGFLTGLSGQWGSRRKKRKIVEASDFGDVLPQGWKLLLSMKRKEGRVWLFCRRYISPNGQQFVSCKEVSSCLLSLSGLQDARQPNYGHNDENSQLAHQISPGNAAGLTLKDDKSKDGLVCSSPSTVTTIPTHHEKQATLLNMGNSWEVKVGEILKCHKCAMTFDEKDDLLHHLSSSHNGTANSCKLSSSICNEVIMKEGKYECRFCHEIFHEENGYNRHVEIHTKTSVKNAETSVLNSDPTPLDGLVSDSIEKTTNGQANDGMSFGLTHKTPKADSIKETHIGKSNNSFFHMGQHFEVTQNDGTFADESVDEQDKDCNTRNDRLGKVHEAPDILAAKTSLAEAALSTSEDRSIQKASNESNVLKFPTDGINELCGSEERISESYSVAPSENQQTCEVEDNVHGASTSLKKELRQEISYESGLATPNDKGETCAEIAEDRLFTSTIKEMKIDCKDEFGQHEPIFDFDNCATYGKDIAINVKQQRVSEDCHLPVPFPNEQKCGFVNNMNGVLSPPIVESNQQRCSKSVTLSGNNQTYDVNNNGSWVSTGTGRPRVEADNSGNNELTFGFGSNHPQPNEDAVTCIEWGISSGSCSLVSSWKDQTCFKNNTNWVSAGTKPLQEKGSESGALTPSCKEQIWGVENNGNKFSIGTMDKLKFDEINNSRNSELIITSGNMSNTGVGMDVVTSVQKQRGSEGYLSILSKNEQKIGAESPVTGFCNSAVAELKLGGHSESGFCIQSDGEQKCGIGNDLKRVYPGRFWEVPRLREVENPSNTELMIGFGSSHAQPGQDVMAEVMWRSDEENVLQSALGNSSSSMVLSSSCFPTFDVISDKGLNGLCTANEKFNTDNIENLKFSSLTAQRNSLSEDSKVLSYDAGMEQGFNSSEWLEKETLLPKVAGRHLVATLCIWCRNEFHHENVGNATQTGSTGLMCPTCKVKFSGELNLF